MSSYPAEPTSDQCENCEVVTGSDGTRWMATWYPQMGGYVSKCLVEIGYPGDDASDIDRCFEAIVWHDGEFPFGSGDRPPAVLHHCSPRQFIRFGEKILEARMSENPLRQDSEEE